MTYEEETKGGDLRETPFWNERRRSNIKDLKVRKHDLSSKINDTLLFDVCFVKKTSKVSIYVSVTLMSTSTF